MSRPLTEDERVALVNAVQGLVGRLDRVVSADARQAAYQAAVKLIMHEYRLRYDPAALEGPPLRAYAPPPPPPPAAYYPPARSYDPFA